MLLLVSQVEMLKQTGIGFVFFYLEPIWGQYVFLT